MLDPYFEAINLTRIDYTTPLTPQQAADLALMTPTARRMSTDDADQDVASVLPTELTISVLVTTYLPR